MQHNMTRDEINAAIARAPKTTEQMLANRRRFIQHQVFVSCMKAADVDAVALADFMGVSRTYVVAVVDGTQPLDASFISGLQAMIKQHN